MYLKFLWLIQGCKKLSVSCRLKSTLMIHVSSIRQFLLQKWLVVILLEAKSSIVLFCDIKVLISVSFRSNYNVLLFVGICVNCFFYEKIKCAFLHMYTYRFKYKASSRRKQKIVCNLDINTRCMFTIVELKFEFIIYFASSRQQL